MMKYLYLMGDYFIMLKILDKLLAKFRCVFSYEASFNWFVIVVLGFVIRFDHIGVTSFIRWLFLSPTHYDALLLFFRTSSWRLEDLLVQWTSMAVNRFPVIRFNDRLLLIGDGIKICKEAFKMPGVKRLHQDSDNSGKGATIWGHHFGYVGLLIGHLKKTSVFHCMLSCMKVLTWSARPKGLTANRLPS